MKRSRRNRRWLSLFDEGYYRSQHPEIGERSAHEWYLSHCWEDGHDPHPLFSVSWYKRAIGERVPDINPLDHYIKRGATRNLDPHPLFDTRYFLRQTRRRASLIGKASALVGGLSSVWRWRAPTPLHLFLSTDPARCASPHWLFDIDLYRRLYPDVVSGGHNPVIHYLTYGERHYRRACVGFEIAYYARKFPDVPAGALLAHFASHSSKQRPIGSPLFDEEWYRRQLSPSERKRTDLLRHFVEAGQRRDLSPHWLFDPLFYREKYGLTISKRESTFENFLASFPNELRSTHPLFVSEFYGEVYLGHQERITIPLVDYLGGGFQAGRNPNPMFEAKYYRELYLGGDTNAEPLSDFMRHSPADRRHPHPLFDCVHYAATLHGEQAGRPLEHYLTHRSAMKSDFQRRGSSSIPVPIRSLLPAMRWDAQTPLESRLVKISIIVPTFETPAEVLRACLDSVLNQDYADWELIVVDDGSASEVPRRLAAAYADRDPRIKALRLGENGGISHATNHGLAMATGDFVAMLDHDDVLLPHALRSIAEASVEAPDIDVFYTDQTFLTQTGNFDGHFYKPGWSPTLFAGVMYLGHLLVVKRELAIEAGSFDPGFDCVQDYEFMLRVSERTSRISHLPKLLYGWRRMPGSIAHDAGGKGKIEPLQVAACQSHLDRIGMCAVAEEIPGLIHRVRLKPKETAEMPRFDLIAMRSGGEYAVAPSGPWGNSLAVNHDDLVALNDALMSGESEFVLVWSDNIDVNPAAIEFLSLHLSMSDIGACSPHLFDKADRALAAGLFAHEVFGLMPAMAGYRYGEDGYAGSFCCDREVSALPCGLVALRRSAVRQVGGLHTDFGSMFYALGDLTYRLATLGWRNVAVAEKLVRVPPEAVPSFDALLIDRILFTERNRGTLAHGDRYYPAGLAFALDK